MNNAGGHMVILAGAGLAAAFLSAYMLAARQSEPAGPEAVVVTLPQRPAPPAPQPAMRPKPGPSSGAPSQAGSGPMSDPAALARTLQRELKRVGCFDGEISGVWGATSRAAMKTFTERVNATLPVDAPDPVLVALVQGHQGRACGACPAGEMHAADGRCVPGAIVGKAQGRPAPVQANAEPKVEPSKAVPGPLSVPLPVPVPAARKPPALVAPSEPAPPRVATAPAEPPPAPMPALPRAHAPDPDDPQATPLPQRRRHTGPARAMRVYGRTIRRFVRRAPSKPAAVARSLMRSLARAAQPW